MKLQSVGYLKAKAALTALEVSLPDTIISKDKDPQILMSTVC